MRSLPAIISLELGAAVLYWLVFVVVESAVLQWINWGDFRQCLRASFLANLASALIIGLSLIYLPRFRLPGVMIGALLATLVEGVVLIRIRPDSLGKDWFAAGLANLVSFVVLLFPVFWFSHG